MTNIKLRKGLGRLMILCVTPNPAIDHIKIVPNFQQGRVCRAVTLQVTAGGKGINVARAIQTLGGQAHCAALLGGAAGQMQAEMLAQEGIPGDWTLIQGETRSATIIVNPGNGETTVVNEMGPEIILPDWERFEISILRLARQAKAICLCGTLPPGVPAGLMASLVYALSSLQYPIWLDTSGETLRTAFQARPKVIKVNGEEAAALLGGGGEIDDAVSAVQAARALQRQGIEQVVLTLGKLGAVSVSQQGAWYAHPPETRLMCTTGSGDSFLAGLMLGRLSGLTEAEALRQAVAAGTANTLTVGSACFTRENFNSVLAGVQVEPVP